RTLNRLDHVVADVHAVGPLGHHLYAECIFISGSGECLVPPARPVQQCCADGLWSAAIQVIHDGLHRLADGSRGVLLLQTVPLGEAMDDRLTNRRRVVHIADAEEARPGIESTLVKSWPR